LGRRGRFAFHDIATFGETPRLQAEGVSVCRLGSRLMIYPE